MKAKKIPYYLLLGSLALGASLIFGLLSFGGMFALWPILSLAGVAMAVLFVYEAEILLQNIKGALGKLFFKRDYLEHHLANDFLLKNFPDTSREDCPQFFKDYEEQLYLLSQISDHKDDKAKKKHVEKKLRVMEKWFRLQLYSKKESKNPTAYANQLQTWLDDPLRKEKYEALLKKRRLSFHGAKAFSLVAGVFMGLGTIYLLVETFTIVPFLATLSVGLWPALIVPMAIVAGTAYGLLTYNALTDMINNDTIRKWYTRVRQDLNAARKTGEFKKIIKPIFMGATALFLAGLAIALTVCTAGTWWTIAKYTPPLFSWMGRMPSFIMGVINPIATGLSALIINLQNASDSVEEIAEVVQGKHHHHEEAGEEVKHGPENKEGFFKRQWNKAKNAYTKLADKENFFQMINIPRLLIMLTLAPLLVVLFLFHLVCMGVTGDRVPGVSKLISAILCIISEFFEDVHYFLPHHHHAHGPVEHSPENTTELLKERFESGHDHDHHNDLPTKFIKFLYIPLYTLAALWDSAASQLNRFNFFNKNKTREVLSPIGAWNKLKGQEKDQGCDLYLISELPKNLAQYKKSYLSIKNGRLYYVKPDGKYEEAQIDNFELFEAKIKALKTRDGNKLHLSKKQIKEIVTLNGGHTPHVKLEDHQSSAGWQLEHSLYSIERMKYRLDKDNDLEPKIATEKIEALRDLQQGLRQIDKDSDLLESQQNPAIIKDALKKGAEESMPILNKHRYSFYNSQEKTRTQREIERLAQQVSAPTVPSAA